jgi:hypothetical protein
MNKALLRRRIAVLFLCAVFFIHCYEVDWSDCSVWDGLLSEKDEVIILVIVDWADFMCPNCLESILSFYHSLPTPFREENIWGIVVLDKEKVHGDAEWETKIIEKKLRGFCSANQIKMPFVLDITHVLVNSEWKKNCVVVLDRSLMQVKRYSFPLSPEDRGGIIQIITQQPVIKF